MAITAGPRTRGAGRLRTTAVTIALATAPLAVTMFAAAPAMAADAITVSPTDLQFPDTYVGASSPPMEVTLTNTGSTRVTPTLTGGALIDRTDFASDGQTCGVLDPGDTCAFRYHFAPTTVGPLSDHTTIGVNGINYPITLSGNGIASFTVSPTTLTFADTVVGVNSGMQSVVLTNVSPMPLHPSLAGGALINRTDFVSDGQTCGTVPSGGTCEFRYHFAPTTVGPLTDHTTIGVNGTNYPITVTGTGLIGFSVAPTTLVFPDTVIGSSTAPQSVVLTNTTSMSLHPNLAGGALINRTDFVSDGQTCGLVPPGGTCEFRYHFAPTTVGALTDHTTIGVNSVYFSITVSGMGITGTSDTSATSTTTTATDTSTPTSTGSSTSTSMTTTSTTTGTTSTSTSMTSTGTSRGSTTTHSTARASNSITATGSTAPTMVDSSAAGASTPAGKAADTPRDNTTPSAVPQAEATTETLASTGTDPWRAVFGAALLLAVGIALAAIIRRRRA